MYPVSIASTAQDDAVMRAVRQHHAQLAGALRMQAAAVYSAANGRDALRARDRLLEWAQCELLPHAHAEEAALYPLARELPEGRVLVDAMLREHELLAGLVCRLGTSADQVTAAAEARSLEAAFESHLAKENDHLLPLLAGHPSTSLAVALSGMHEILGDHDVSSRQAEPDGRRRVRDDDTAPQAAGEPPACGCGERDQAELPELDARQVPHAIRHATVFGALDSLGAGGGLVLVAPHDPVPLLTQVEARTPGAFAVEYLERGPAAWRVRFVRS